MVVAQRTAASPARRAPSTTTLAIDVGGSGLKASVLDELGDMLVDRVRVETPIGGTPELIVEKLVELAARLPAFDRISVGFPGVVRDGRVLTAPNLGHDGWKGFDLARTLRQRLNRPVRIANDADLQGLAVIVGQGLEMVVTLGTGFGTGLYWNGRLAPHLEISQIPFRKGETYDQHLGNTARKLIGDKKWNERVGRAIATLRTLTNFDRLYVGGGNAKKLTIKLPESCTIVSNDAGIRGGIALWRKDLTL